MLAYDGAQMVSVAQSFVCFFFVRWKGVWLGKTQYLLTNFARRLLQVKKFTVE